MIQADIQWLATTLDVNAEKCADSKQSITTISTDSRTIEPGQAFLALKGPNFDGHRFIEDVKQKGATCVIVDHLVDVDIPQLVVKDTLRALGRLGAEVKRTVNPKTLAITGSVGKTSVKEMCAAILAQKGEVLATGGNFNNEIGVPLTLLRLEPKHEYAVIELGANHIGEIAYTTSLTQPNVAILNNVAEAHLEGFGSLDGVVTAKGEIFQGLKQSGVAVVNADSPYKQIWLDELEQKFSNQSGSTVQFSLQQGPQQTPVFYADNIELNALGCAEFDLKFEQQIVKIELVVPGKHNVANALAAATACYNLGASFEDIQNGLKTMQKVKGRVNLNQVSERLSVIDDTYNANVRSVKAAIDLVTGFEGKSMLVLGDMGELGHEARRLHQEVGEYGLEQGLDYLISFGVLSQSASKVFENNGEHFSTKQSLIESVNKLIQQNSEKMTILVKGSRSAKMELVVQQLIEDNQ